MAAPAPPEPTVTGPSPAALTLGTKEEGTCQHILVTTDSSPLGHLALPYAADLASRYGSALTLVYVVPPLPTGVFGRLR